jgi:membrane peptidoglycan carboxypeptidase
VTSGTGTRARLDDGRPQAGKTGTAENYGNAWYCGYTTDIATCVWVGYRSSNKPLQNIEGFGAVYGGTIPAMIWKDFMTTATRRLKASDWPEPKNPVVYKEFDTTTSFGYNPAPPAAPAAPEKKPSKKPKAPPPSPPTQVVIAPQN